MSVASQLAKYVIHAFQNDVPENIKEIGIQAIIDQYGLQIAGSELPSSKTIYKAEKYYNQSIGLSSIARYGDQVSPVHAAFINGSFAHAKDFDDTHQKAQTHAGSVVIPAAMAIAESKNCSPDVVLKAIIWGMEIMLRLAYSISPVCMEGGHHTCPTIGPFGSAIACGLLMGLNETELTHALGICGSFSGALMEFTLSGGSVKRIYPGLGARHGLEAVILAKEGLTAPATIIEGKKGLWSILGKGLAFPERLFEQLGESYLLSSISFKPFSCCLLIHPAIEAFLKICNRYRLVPENINHITVGFSKLSASHVGSITIPEDELGAQFSTSFMLALSLIKEPPGMWTNIVEALSDTEIVNLAKKVTIYEDEEAEIEFPAKNGCIVNVHSQKGKIYSLRIKDPKGSYGNKLTIEDIKKKFIQNTLPILGPLQAKNLYHLLSKFDKLSSVKNIFHASTEDIQMVNLCS
jgi:2-methylcitrate dehydratase PrpD